MSAANDKASPLLKQANTNAENNKLAHHNYVASAALVPMETLSGSSIRRSLNVTPTKLPPARKLTTEPSLVDILSTIRSLDNKVEDFCEQLKESSDMFASIVQRVELNTRMEVMKKEHLDLKTEDIELKEKNT